MSLKSIQWVGVLLCLICLSFLPAKAQFTSGIQGVVTDPTGSSVPNAIVHVTDIGTGVSREATTSNDGLYRVTNLGLGTYRVNVAVPGFAPAERPNVSVGLHEIVRADFVLTVGNIAEQLTVTGEISQVETEVGHISSAIEPLRAGRLRRLRLYVSLGQAVPKISNMLRTPNSEELRRYT
jgi:hypothetical protein